MARIYTGIGSRNTPADVLTLAGTIARRLSDQGWHLRSGGARGADQAFEIGCCGACDSYAPVPQRYAPADWAMAESIAAQHHPAWTRCSGYVRQLHTRNVFQILGHEGLNEPSRFVLCWTPDGCEDGTRTTRATGGTGQALRIAATFGVPIYNLANPATRQRIERWLA